MPARLRAALTRPPPMRSSDANRRDIQRLSARATQLTQGCCYLQRCVRPCTRRQEPKRQQRATPASTSGGRLPSPAFRELERYSPSNWPLRGSLHVINAGSSPLARSGCFLPPPFGLATSGARSRRINALLNGRSDREQVLGPRELLTLGVRQELPVMLGLAQPF